MEIKRLLALFMALITVPSVGFATSFDCSRARNFVEKLICSNKSISKLDAELGSTYKYVLGFTYGRAKESLVAGQKDWIANIRDKCGDAYCLSDAYNSRIEALTRIKTEKSVGRYVADQKERSAKTSEFQEDLKRAGITGRLTACDLMVEVTDDLSGGDQSYGAVCKLNNRWVMICNDTMIGKLTVKHSGFAINGNEVADFTQNNCPRGG